MSCSEECSYARKLWIMEKSNNFPALPAKLCKISGCALTYQGEYFM